MSKFSDKDLDDDIHWKNIIENICKLDYKIIIGEVNKAYSEFNSNIGFIGSRNAQIASMLMSKNIHDTKEIIINHFIEYMKKDDIDDAAILSCLKGIN